MMTGYIRHVTGLRLGVHSVGRALKPANPQQHRERQTSITRHLNRVPYFVECFGHKLHLDREACALWRHRGNRQVVFGGIISLISPQVSLERCRLFL